MQRRAFLQILAAAPAAAQSGSQVLDIGGRRELLIDEFLVAAFQGGARLRLHQPRREEVALVHDAPWEGSGTGYHTIFRDGDRYRMYYKAWHLPPDARQPGKLRFAYAESRDGIQWVKPELGLVEVNGSKANNVILDNVGGGPAHDMSPFLDENPRATGPRYKAFALNRKPRGLLAMGSDDGIRWRPLRPEPVLTDGVFDTQNIAFWDPTIGRYRAYIRDFDKGRRDIKTATSENFLDWSPLEWLNYPGAPAEALYTNQVKPYYRAPHLLIGFPARYVDRGWTPSTRLLPEYDLRRRRAAANERYATTVTDSLLMTSRDGRNFRRWDEAFLRPGLRTRYNWTYGDNYLAWHVIETASPRDDEGRELSLFATEAYFTGDRNRLRRYSLRIDGFASVFAPLSGGTVRTHLLRFEGVRLLLNLATSASGGLRVEIQGADGLPLPGYAMADCDELFGDGLELPVTWRGDSGVSRLQGQSVCLVIALRDADLYSLRFG